jgi:uncharacterized protein YndB with AHSA1/START domain
MAQRIVSVSKVIPAPPEKIFDLLANPEGHVTIDGSGTLVSVKSNPTRLSKGAKFGMKMKLGVPYSVTNTVCEFEENRVIAWHHMAQFIWRYDLEPVEGGTKVTESFDYSKPWGALPSIAKKAEANKKYMAATLDRIAELVSTP